MNEKEGISYNQVLSYTFGKNELDKLKDKFIIFSKNIEKAIHNYKNQPIIQSINGKPDIDIVIDRRELNDPLKDTLKEFENNPVFNGSISYLDKTGFNAETY